MNYNKIKTVFKTERQATELLEKIVWGAHPVCPFCKSLSCFFVAHENRYHCNNCNTRFSVMTLTPFRKSKVDLRKWIVAIMLQNNITIRALANEIETSKDTANLMIKKLKSTTASERELLKKIVTKVHELVN